MLPAGNPKLNQHWIKLDSTVWRRIKVASAPTQPCVPARLIIDLSISEDDF